MYDTAWRWATEHIRTGGTGFWSGTAPFEDGSDDCHLHAISLKRTGGLTSGLSMADPSPLVEMMTGRAIPTLLTARLSGFTIA